MRCGFSATSSIGLKSAVARDDRFSHVAAREAPSAAAFPLHSSAANVKVVIVEDHLMFREVLRKVCAKELRLQVVGEAADGRTAVEMVTKHLPELVLLDLHLPVLDGFGVVEAVRTIAPETRILVLSSHCDEFTVFRAERARVQGFVDKNTNSVATLKEAIGAVKEGKVWFSEAFRRIKAARHEDQFSFDKLLTDRERVIVGLVGQPLDDREIATRLKISKETVEKHRFNILRKLGLANTTDLVRYAREHGFTLVAPKSSGDAMLP